MRKLTLFTLLMFTIVGIASCTAKGIKKKSDRNMITPDTTVYQTLGKSLSEVLLSPTKVNVYSLKLKDRVGKEDVEVEDHVVRDTLITTLTADEIAILQFILIADGDSYKNDSIIVRSPYVPVIEFEFVKKKVTAQVIISLSDRTWTIWYDDRKEFNYNYAYKEGVKRFCSKLLEQNKK